MMQRWRPIIVHWAGRAMEKQLAWWRMRQVNGNKSAPVAADEDGTLPPMRIEPMLHQPVASSDVADRTIFVASVSVTPLVVEAAMDTTLVPSLSIPVAAPPQPLPWQPSERSNHPGANAPPLLIQGGEKAAPSPLVSVGKKAAPSPLVSVGKKVAPSPLVGEGQGEGASDPLAVLLPPAAVMVRRLAPPPPVLPFALPPLDLLDPPPPRHSGTATEVLEGLSRLVETLLKSFGIEVRVVAVEPGPVITRFEVEPAPGVKVSQISNLAKDLARGLSVISVRVVEIIPGKSVIGLEIPNPHRQIVYLREVLESATYEQSTSPLTLVLGKDISGNPTVANLGKMPHLLVAGTTGSGKSVAINAMLLSLLYKAQPHEVRLILVDPKMLELSIYEDIPHLLTPVVGAIS